MVTVANSIVLLLVCAVQVECGDNIPDKKCATLYSAPNFGGSSFTLKDFDQSVDLTREYRQFLNGLTKTGSIRVENGCKIAVCDGTYFEGYCDSYSNDTPELRDVSFIAKSANCTCERKCSCEDIYITQDQNGWATIGRAYLQGGCDTCNTDYIELNSETRAYRREDMALVETIVLRNGCSIDIFEGDYHDGHQYPAIEGPIYRGWNGTFGTHRAECKPFEYIHPPSRFDFYVRLGEIPLDSGTHQELHPAIQAARESARNGRSSRNAYVVLIGNCWELYYQFDGFPQCKIFSPGNEDVIRRFHIPVGIDDLQITTELRIIFVPIDLQSDQLSDDKQVEQLIEYLNAYEDLRGAVPNAVIVQHDFQTKEVEEDDSWLQRRMRILSALQGRQIVGNDSTVMFIMKPKDFLNCDIRNPEAKITEFEKMLKDKYGFPMPASISIDLICYDKLNLHSVNGFTKMANEEYWPKHMQNSLINICERGGDPLGKAIFKAAFQDNWTPHGSIEPFEGFWARDHHYGSELEATPAYEGYCECSTIKVEIDDEIEKAKADLEEMKTQISANAARIRQIWLEMVFIS